MERVDIAVIGAGAAGILAALAARGAIDARGAPVETPGREAGSAPEGAPSVVLLDGQERPGKKILISGGGRCNVTNARVRDVDYDTQHPHLVRGVLRGFPVASVQRLFDLHGVRLTEEPLGKLFPKTGRSKTVLVALLGAVERAGIGTRFGTRIETLEPGPDGWRVGADLVAGRVIVAAGGLSVPETGSDGWGLALARRLGHTIVPTVPALAPLLGNTPQELAGLTITAILSVLDGAGRTLRRATGGLLFTHRGVSGPAPFDVSVAVEREVAAGRPFRVVADAWTAADPAGPLAVFQALGKPPGACLPDSIAPTPPADLGRELVAAARRGRGTVGAYLDARLPRRLIRVLVPHYEKPLAQLTREERGAVAGAVCALDLHVTGSEGYRKAEVTAGGVSLGDLERRTLESRVAPGLHFCGEVCDATGRLGGFNFQWAWSSGYAAGAGARSLSR